MTLEPKLLRKKTVESGSPQSKEKEKEKSPKTTHLKEKTRKDSEISKKL